MNNDKNYIEFNSHSQKCAPDDFWGQVKRTVGGKPIPQDQIDMIVNAVVMKLGLKPTDVLLDICCGNGALTTLFFKFCGQVLGVDFSDYLIKVANENFAQSPDCEFFLGGAVDYVMQESNPERFTAAVCYGSFQYLDTESAQNVLWGLRKRFSKLERLLIGNHPDKERIMSFYTEETYVPGVENDSTATLGMWRSKDDFMKLAHSTGWTVEFSTMPTSYHASHYRQDILFIPR